MATELAILVLLILANGIFAGAELAILSIRKTRLQELVDEGSSRAEAVDSLRRDPERFLATVQIGITVIGATAAAFGGASLSARLQQPLQALGLEPETAENAAFAIVVAGISYLSLVLGELVPKSLALKFSEGYGLSIAKPLQWLSFVAKPLVWLLTASSNVFLRLFGDRTNFSESRLSPDELQQLVEEAARTGALNPRAGEIASRAFDLGELRVSGAMVPRGRMVALSRNAAADELRRFLVDQGHSRAPVYDDTIDNVVGYVVAKDLIPMALNGGTVVLEKVLRPVAFFPETKRAVDALKELQQRRTHLAMVVDEAGAISGLVTIEDLVEEVVGDIFSEHDQPVEHMQKDVDGTFVVQATIPLRDLNRQLDLELPEGDGYSTLAGLVLVLAGSIPKPGTKVTAADGTLLEVLDASQRRVRTVRLRPPPHAPTEQDEGSAPLA